MRKHVQFSSIIMIFLLFSVFISPTPVKAAGCECVAYVKNYFGITDSVGNAYQMGSWLTTHGFVRISSPQVGAVAVMQPGFPGADKIRGHVGIVEQAVDGGTTWTITLRNANADYGTLISSEYGCNNVKKTSWRPYLKNSLTSSLIAYYKISKYQIRSVVAQSGYPSLYFHINSNSTLSGALVIAYTSTGTKNQLFNFIAYGTEFRIIARNSGMCVQPVSVTLGAKLVQKKCMNYAIEKWKRTLTSNGYYVFTNSATGLVADLTNGSLTPGNSIAIRQNKNTKNQFWWLDRVP